MLSVLSVLLLLLLSGVRRCLGALCGLMASAHIDKGRLSLCFNSLGNSITDLFNIVRGLSGLFGIAQGSSGLFGECSGLLKAV